MDSSGTCIITIDKDPRNPKDPRKDSGKGSGKDSGKNSGKNPGKNPGKNSGKVPGKDSNKNIRDAEAPDPSSPEGVSYYYKLRILFASS